MTNRKPRLILSIFLLAFYSLIILYIIFKIQHIYLLPNFCTAFVFELIGFLLLYLAILNNLLFKPIQVGFYLPLVTVTVIYTGLLDLITIWGAAIIAPVFFFLIQFVLLFIYCLVSIPLYLLGKR